MKSGNGRPNTNRAITFSLREGTNENILPKIYRMLRQAEKHADISESRLNGTIYVDPFTTNRAVKRAIGFLKGFPQQVNQESVAILPIDEVEHLFNTARRKEEKRAQFFPV